MMRQFLIAALFLLSACAPSQVIIPTGAPLVPGEPKAQVNANAAVSYKLLSDSVVSKRIRITKIHGDEVSRRELDHYHVAPASREAITKALKKVFPTLTVANDKLPLGTYDVIIIPKLVDLELPQKRSIYHSTEAHIEYALIVLDGRDGSTLGIMSFRGYSTAGVGEHRELSGDQRAITRAMEDALKGITADLPDHRTMAPWREN